VPNGTGVDVIHLKPGGPLTCSDGEVLFDWCLAGYGLAWRSTWEVQAEVASGALVSVRLADNRRLCVATPAYLARYGTPQTPADLVRFHCLSLSSDASQTRGWAFRVPTAEGSEVVYLKPAGPLDCSDGQVLHDWCLDGYGIAWRSTWEVEAEIAAGRLLPVLDAYAAPPNGIYAIFPERKYMPLRVRLWIDFLKHHFGAPAFWKSLSK
jgi:DNA-binding transcriptional LysR family regulator